MRKIMKTLAAAAAVSALCVSTVWAGTWKNDAGGYWYQNDDGSYLMNGVKEVDGANYCFGADGYMKTGWQYVNYGWKFFEPSGVQAFGWKQDAGQWYYLDPANGGNIKVGWFDEGGKRYHFKDSGAMDMGIFFLYSGEDQYAYCTDNTGAIYRNTELNAGEGKKYKFMDDGVMYYQTTTTKNTGFSDTWNLYKEGYEQQLQKEFDESVVAERAVEIMDEYYVKYKKSMQTSNASRRTAKKSQWESFVKSSLKDLVTEGEITSYISKVESGLYVPSNEVDDIDEDYDYSYDDYYDDED